MRINQKYKIRQIAGENVIIMQGEYEIDLTKIISFNESSKWLWNNLLGKDFSQKDVEELLVSHYDVSPDIAVDDANEWIEKLIHYNLIES